MTKPNPRAVRAARSAAPRSAAGLAIPAPSHGIVIAVLFAFLVLYYRDTLRFPFVTDDYFFLAKVRRSSFADLWAPHDLLSGFYRPWSRELPFWILDRLFHVPAAAFRALNQALWLGTLAAFFLLARKLADVATAAIATAGVAAIASWGVLLMWPSGGQDLWMILFAMLYLLAWFHRRNLLAAAALLLALLSKETASGLPALTTAAWLLLERRKGAPSRTPVQMVIPWAIVAVWALLHPSIGGRLLHPGAEGFRTAAAAPLGWAAVLRVLALFNLDPLPAPLVGWPRALLLGVPVAMLLGGLAAWGARARERSASPPPADRPDARRVVIFGLAWWAIAWLPAFLPSLQWHAYYGMLGALGAWLAIAVGLASAPWIAAALVCAIAILRPAQSTTLSTDWGSEDFQRRVSVQTLGLRDDLLRRHPRVPSHSRIFVGDVPHGLAMIAGPGDSPMLCVWYQDPTLRGHFFESFQSRAPGDTLGQDFFLVATKTNRWVELTPGADSVDPETARSPEWHGATEYLAKRYAQVGDWNDALRQFRLLAAADPNAWQYARNLSVCHQHIGAADSAAFWFARSVELERAASARGTPGGGSP